MANLKASKKDILVNKRNRERNKHYKTLLKNSLKHALSAIESKVEDLETIVRATLRQIDKTASKKVIMKKKASRLKSSLHKKFNASKV